MVRRPSFSERQGYTKPPSIQVSGMDEGLRIALWNVFHGFVRSLERAHDTKYARGSKLEHIFHRYWDFLKWPVDGIPFHTFEADVELKAIFLEGPWHLVYDFIEVVAETGPAYLTSSYVGACNTALEQNVAAFRFLDGKLIKITSEEELQSISDALENTLPFSGANAHLKTAVHHLSQRQNPDYRNSVKESISAVESMCQVFTSNPSASLGDALNEMDRHQAIHPALKGAFSKLYGYTSNADGIRHGMLDEATLSYVDAKFMMVACTAFINYLVGKAAERGVTIPSKRAAKAAASG